jgi:Ribonuclease G/E
MQKIIREIRRHYRDMAGHEFIVRVSTEMADYIVKEEGNVLLRLENEFGKHIRIQKNADFHIEEFEITEKVQY